MTRRRFLASVSNLKTAYKERTLFRTIDTCSERALCGIPLFHFTKPFGVEFLVFTGVFQFLQGLIHAVHKGFLVFRGSNAVEVTLFRRADGFGIAGPFLLQEVLKHGQITDDSIHVTIFEFDAGKVRRVEIRHLGAFNLFGFLGARRTKLDTNAFAF